MPDICDVIYEEHAYFYRAVDELHEARSQGPGALVSLWEMIATVFERHAAAEEEILYPALLPRAEHGVEDTEDAIKDHNIIKEAVRQAAVHEVGTEPWWAAVDRARAENDEHMQEEEREGLPDFTPHSEPSVREDLGSRFLAFNAAHPRAEGLDLSDKEPDEYIRAPNGG